MIPKKCVKDEERKKASKKEKGKEKGGGPFLGTSLLGAALSHFPLPSQLLSRLLPGFLLLLLLPLLPPPEPAGAGDLGGFMVDVGEGIGEVPGGWGDSSNPPQEEASALLQGEGGGIPAQPIYDNTTPNPPWDSWEEGGSAQDASQSYEVLGQSSQEASQGGPDPYQVNPGSQIYTDSYQSYPESSIGGESAPLFWGDSSSGGDMVSEGTGLGGILSSPGEEGGPGEARDQKEEQGEGNAKEKEKALNQNGSKEEASKNGDKASAQSPPSVSFSRVLDFFGGVYIEAEASLMVLSYRLDGKEVPYQWKGSLLLPRQEKKNRGQQDMSQTQGVKIELALLVEGEHIVCVRFEK